MPKPYNHKPIVKRITRTIRKGKTKPAFVTEGDILKLNGFDFGDYVVVEGKKNIITIKKLNI